MSILAQCGHGWGNKVEDALQKQYISGCILSPKDSTMSSMVAKIRSLTDEYGSPDIFFDPQFYASIVAHENGARLGCLPTDYSAYFKPRQLKDFRREKHIIEIVKNCINFQSDSLHLQKVISPNLMIEDGLDSASANIAKNFLEIGAEEAAEKKINSNVWLTLTLGQSCFRNEESLYDFVDEITGMNLNVKGFYLIIESSKGDGNNPWFTPEVLSGQMFLVYALAKNGFDVICGYSFLSSPYLAAVGAKRNASGWFNSQRFFSLDHYRESKAGGRRANRRYLTNLLWYPLEHPIVEANNLYNGLSSDAPYKETPTDSDEVSQYWETLKNEELSILSEKQCERKLKILNDRLTFFEINLSKKYPLRLPAEYRQQIKDCKRSLIRFAELAELPFFHQNT